MTPRAQERSDHGLVGSSPEGETAFPVDSQANCVTSSRTGSKAERKRARREARIAPCEPICVECGALAERVKGDRIYPHRADLFRKSFYLCVCGAYVGCHPYTRIALGRPAGELTRAARGRAHNAFDILWRRKMRLTGCAQAEARNAAYAWLGAQLGYAPGNCHIGWMTADEANRVVALCNPFVHRRGTGTGDTSQHGSTCRGSGRGESPEDTTEPKTSQVFHSLHQGETHDA